MSLLSAKALAPSVVLKTSATLVVFHGVDNVRTPFQNLVDNFARNAVRL